MGVNLSDRGRAALFRGLAILLGAGVAPERALALMAGLAGHGGEGRAAAALRERVLRGATLAEAMATVPALRGRAVDMVRAGEACGGVAVVASRLAAVSERSLDLKRGIAASILVPLLLLLATVTAMAALATVHVSVDTGAVGGAGLWWVPLLAGLAVAGVLAQRAGDPRLRLAVDGWLLRLPLVGRLVARRECVRLLSGLALLLEGGVALAPALALLGGRSGNAAVAAALGRASSMGLAQVLGQDWFPPPAARLLRDGESGYRLAAAAAQAAQLLRRRLI